MKLIFSTILLSTICIASFAQINFEKGYIIDNNGKKVECFIKNEGWIKNPIKIEYKLSLTNESDFSSIENMSEFAIEGQYKFIRVTIDIDTSKRFVKYATELSESKEPEWKSVQVLLKVLVEGSANLYYYEADFIRFFYSKNNSPIKQLICKEYSIDGVFTRTNKDFQQQLLTELNNEQTKNTNFERVRYDDNELTRYFSTYNNANNKINSIINSNKTRGVFKFNIVTGIYNSTYQLRTRANWVEPIIFSEPVSSLRLGLELEYVLPFKKNKFSIVFEPAFSSINFIADNTVNGKITGATKNVELTIGLRHYMFLTDNVTFYISGNIHHLIGLNSYLKINDKQYDENKSVKISGALGLGIKWKKMNVEFRTVSSINRIFNFGSTDYYKLNTNSLLFGYTIFNTKKK